jgi:hypothetical protein
MDSPDAGIRIDRQVPDENGAHQQRQEHDDKLKGRDLKREQAFEPTSLSSQSEPRDRPDIEHKGDRQPDEEADCRSKNRNGARRDQLIGTAETGELRSQGRPHEQDERGDEHKTGDAAPWMSRARASLGPSRMAAHREQSKRSSAGLTFPVSIYRNPLAEVAVQRGHLNNKLLRTPALEVVATSFPPARSHGLTGRS